MSTIFDALTTQINSLTAVNALVNGRVRPLKLAQKDDISAGGAILLDPETETNEVDNTGRGGAETLMIAFQCVAETLASAYAIAVALNLNGTNPGTGLGAFSGTVLSIFIQSIILQKKTFHFVFYEDGSDEGYYVVAWHGQVIYSEAT